jgi:fatty acid-binding protein DegV
MKTFNGEDEMNIRIVTDSTCDLPEQTVRQHHISVIPLHINQGEKSFRDGIDLSREEFYAQLPQPPAPNFSGSDTNN